MPRTPPGYGEFVRKNVINPHIDAQFENVAAALGLLHPALPTPRSIGFQGQVGETTTHHPCSQPTNRLLMTNRFTSNGILDHLQIRIANRWIELCKIVSWVSRGFSRQQGAICGNIKILRTTKFTRKKKYRTAVCVFNTVGLLIRNARDWDAQTFPF